MWLLFAVLLGGALIGIESPVALAGKRLNLFDAAFVALTIKALVTGRWRSVDRPLIAAAGLFVSMTGIAYADNPSPQGARALIVLAYSLIAFLVAAHFPVTARPVASALSNAVLAATAFAWLVFLLENGLGLEIGDNRSKALPDSWHRLGGVTGGNPLALLLAMAAPFFARRPALMSALVVSAFFTLSRSILGVGASLALALVRIRPGSRGGRAVGLLAASALMAAGLFAYLYSALPHGHVSASSLAIETQPGGYPPLHVAALRMLWRHPLTGIGPGRFPLELGSYATPEELAALPAIAAPVWAPHSAILGLAAEQGLPSLCVFVTILALTLKRIGAGADETFRSQSLACVVGLLLAGAFLDWLSLKAVWFSLGLLISASAESAPSAAKADSRQP